MEQMQEVRAGQRRGICKPAIGCVRMMGSGWRLRGCVTPAGRRWSTTAASRSSTPTSSAMRHGASASGRIMRAPLSRPGLPLQDTEVWRSEKADFFSQREEPHVKLHRKSPAI